MFSDDAVVAAGSGRGGVAGLGGCVDVVAAQAQLARAMVSLVLAALAECGLVVVHPRDDEVIATVADQIEGARRDGAAPAEAALLVLDALSEGVR